MIARRYGVALVARGRRSFASTTRTDARGGATRPPRPSAEVGDGATGSRATIVVVRGRHPPDRAHVERPVRFGGRPTRGPAAEDLPAPRAHTRLYARLPLLWSRGGVEGTHSLEIRSLRPRFTPPLQIFIGQMGIPGRGGSMAGSSLRPRFGTPPPRRPVVIMMVN